MNLAPTVLLVEDSLDDSYFFERAARKGSIKCTVKHVLDGDAAIDVLREGKNHPATLPDFVFLDLKMPVRNGFEVLEWMRGQALPESMVVVVLSGSNQEADMARARDLGAAGYLVKPITSEILAHWLQNSAKEIHGAFPPRP